MNLEKPECKRRSRVCTELASDKCTQITNCKAIKLDSVNKACKLVTIDSPTCKINDSGECVIDQGNADYQNCAFDVDDDGIINVKLQQNIVAI